jgi:hypothetical protein
MSRTFFFDYGAATATARRASPPASQPVTVAAKRSRERLVVIVAQAALVLSFVVIGSILVAWDEIRKRFAPRAGNGGSK